MTTDVSAVSLRTAADVVEEPVRWLWTEHLALGKIAVVAGVGNAGKSLLVAGDFAARVSTGSPWPDGSGCTAGDVLIASGHDLAADTLVPRLRDHGANLKRVHFLEGLVSGSAGEPEPARRFALGDLLEQALRQRAGVKLVVIDPVSAFLSDRAARSRARCRRCRVWQAAAGRRLSWLPACASRPDRKPPRRGPGRRRRR